MENSTIFVCGHLSPDLDSVASAIAYADFQNQLTKTTNYQPTVAGEINRETIWALEKFGFTAPQQLSPDLPSGQKLVLVDHNEAGQRLENYVNFEITGIIDHHKVNFEGEQPIEIITKPLGATCSIIYELYQINQIAIAPNLAGLMLSAILVDTVITKSPTCTPTDLEIIPKLAALAGIDNWQAFGLELFKIRASVSELSAEQILMSDFKDFLFHEKKFGIGQVETVDLNEFRSREAELRQVVSHKRQEGNYHTVILFITDIINEGSWFIIDSAQSDLVGQALSADFQTGDAYIPGILSRKKQVIPPLTQLFSN